MVHGKSDNEPGRGEGDQRIISPDGGRLKARECPPPHVHSREDEQFYVIEGGFDVYAGEELFQVSEGGCVILPRLKPHAFIIRSLRLRVLALFAPGGIEEAFRSRSTTAQSLELPAAAPSYSTADLAETVRRLSEQGVRILTPEEIASQLPLYLRARIRG